MTGDFDWPYGLLFFMSLSQWISKLFDMKADEHLVFLFISPITMAREQDCITRSSKKQSELLSGTCTK